MYICLDFLFTKSSSILVSLDNIPQVKFDRLGLSFSPGDCYLITVLVIKCTDSNRPEDKTTKRDQIKSVIY